MRLTTVTNISVDGVVQGPGAPDEDRRNGFVRGGWALSRFDETTHAFLARVYARAHAFLFGRRTYEIFARSWGVTEPTDPIASALNTKPKYVASTTLTHPRWEGTTVLSGDLRATIEELKLERTGELQVHGSAALVRWLLARHLVDEITLVTYPVVVGRGTRLFAEGGPETALDLVDLRTTPTGTALQVYRPADRTMEAAAPLERRTDPRPRLTPGDAERRRPGPARGPALVRRPPRPSTG